MNGDSNLAKLVMRTKTKRPAEAGVTERLGLEKGVSERRRRREEVGRSDALHLKERTQR